MKKEDYSIARNFCFRCETKRVKLIENNMGGMSLEKILEFLGVVANNVVKDESGEVTILAVTGCLNNIEEAMDFLKGESC